VGRPRPALEQTRELIRLAVNLAKNCLDSYRAASPETRKLLNQAIFEHTVVKDRRAAQASYAEPFATPLGGSDKSGLVARAGVEPATPRFSAACSAN
jgi:hypothetical protein